MNSKRKAKKALKTFGKETYKSRVEYVDSFLSESTSRISSIAYRHAARRLVMVVLLLILIMAFAVSVHAAVKHYFNFTKLEHANNDEYVPNDYNTESSKVVFFEPKYIPEGYQLESVTYDEVFDDKKWIYRNAEGDILEIQEGSRALTLTVDNEHSKTWSIEVDDIEIIVYSFADSIMGIMQIEDTVIIIAGPVSAEEMKKIVQGLYK